MRTAAALVLCAALAGGCGLLPDPQRNATYGQAASAALDVSSSAAALARGIADRVSPLCRSGELPQGAVTVTTTVNYARKFGVLSAERLIETRVWRRDAAGAIASSTELRFTLPDGRPAHRTTETRFVEGRYYRAIDGRFADATRIRDIDEQLSDDARELADSVLTLARARRVGLATATAQSSICPSPRAPELPAMDGGALVSSPAGRRGWMRWTDDDGVLVIVSFDERIEAGAEPVELPSELVEVEQDDTWRRVDAFVQRGLREGWLAPARELEVHAP